MGSKANELTGMVTLCMWMVGSETEHGEGWTGSISDQINDERMLGMTLIKWLAGWQSEDKRSFLPWVPATYRATMPQLGPQAPVLLGELLHLAVQAYLRQREPIHAAAQFLQLLPQLPLGGAVLAQPARRLRLLPLCALRPGPQSVQLCGLGDARGTGLKLLRGATRTRQRVRGLQLCQQKSCSTA